MPSSRNSVWEAFFLSTEASLTASNADYKSTFGNSSSALPGSVNLGSLSSDFQAIVTYAHSRLGSPIVSTELTPEQIAIAFESANLKFSAIVNTYFIESWFVKLLGLDANYTTYDFQRALPSASNNIFYSMFMNSMGFNQGIHSGLHDKKKGYIDVQVGQQLYDVYSASYDKDSGLPLEQYIASVSGYGAHFVEFYYNAGTYANRLYDPLTNQQFTQYEFGMPAYPIDTVFYILPIWQDVMRGQLLQSSDFVRKSSYRYAVHRRKLELIPRPKNTTRVWFDYYLEDKPGTEHNMLLDSSFSGFSYLSSSGADRVATNFGNVPVSDLTYENMNAIGRNWIREYTLALCAQTLGWIRGKFKSIPFGNETVSMNDGDLLAWAQGRMTELETWLSGELGKVDSYQIATKEALKAQQQLLILQLTSPMPIMVYPR